jgi:branched-chain amino acid transport system ATP-binding protein
MLEVSDIHTFYGMSHILFGISIDVQIGEVVCLLGRNGAGKTTTMRSIVGLTPPRHGSIKFKDEEITGKKPYVIVRRGIGFVPEDRRIFSDLTVGENLEIGKRRAETRALEWNKDRVYELFPKLSELDSRKGGHLSGGEQEMLTIARTLMGNPDLLLLDEPTEGLAPMVVKAVEERIIDLKEAGLSILLAEQNVFSALGLSDRSYIIDNGQIVYEGSANDLTENHEIRKKHLLL